MANRSGDRLKQAARDLEQAEESRGSARHEWACFAAHQAAEKAVKALHLNRGQEAWGHVVARLLDQLPAEVRAPAELVEKGRSLRRPRGPMPCVSATSAPTPAATGVPEATST
jgi:HEPN domain-containing protein